MKATSTLQNVFTHNLKAWLMRDAVSATLATPPDVLINVGGHHLPPMHTATTKYHQFAAHRHVVSAHSGYLKALLTSTPGQAVSVPNIGPEAFGPLLTYMYTGYLDVNVENIYSILLATHLLHMPRALDHCRAFLVQNQQPSLHPGELAGSFLAHHGGEATEKHCPREDLPTLVKPIPSRKMLPVLFNLPGPVPPVGAGYWPHLSYPLPPPPAMMTNSHSPFKTVLPTLTGELREPGYSPTGGRPPRDGQDGEEGPKTPVRPPPRKRPRSPPPPAVPSTSAGGGGGGGRTVLLRVTSPVRSSSVSPCLSDSSSLDSDRPEVKERRRRRTKPVLPSAAPRKAAEEVVCGAGGKVIIDVACCDGPVRFHRVLNDNYGFAVDEIVLESEAHENVGIASMRKELAVRRSAQNNNSIPKKMPKLSANAVSTRTEKVDELADKSKVVELQERPACGGVSLTEQNLHRGGEMVGDVPASDCVATTCTESIHEINAPSETTGVDVSTQNQPSVSLHCVDSRPEMVHQVHQPEAPISYQQLGGFINVEASETSLVQSEAYENNINHSGSSSNQSGNSPTNIQQLGEVSTYSNQPTTSANSDFQSGSTKIPNQSSSTKPGSDSIYTCVYCNHTFKSHYCYQKHARRHINPVTLDMNNLVDRLANKTTCNQASKVPDKTTGVRREVRLLDMNVQYYPCKTCGSKFPSYYFVHKHRKMCHADEADEITGSEESQTHSQSTTINSV